MLHMGHVHQAECTCLNLPGHKHHDAARDGWLEVLGGDVDFARAKRQGRKLGDDGLGALNLLPLKREHAGILVQRRQ